ncbi:MAG: TonB-dependent receptor [Xanthomonadales bacterium]|jgi:TonB-dependent receptor|nr:TonB-dependent receptor [Xanthomonadales bacterium]
MTSPNHLPTGPRARLSLCISAALSLGFLAPAAFADALVQGRIVDAATERPLPSAEVRIEELGRRVVTDSSGRYRLGVVPDGQYTLVVSNVGYSREERTITVSGEATVSEDLALGALSAVEEVMVMGFRVAQISAVQDKQASDLIKDSITADDAGKLPDMNAAEALQRVPGVSITIDQGEGRYVAVRGIDPGLNNVTIDGASIGAPEADDRRIALDTIPSNVLAKLEVIKTVTPDLDANSIGGTVNLVTPSPYDDEDGFMFRAAADIGYYDLNEENPYGGSMAWSQLFGSEDQFGILLSGSYSFREYRSENVQGNVWQEEGDFFVPEELVLRDYVLERERQGIVANFEWRPSDTVQVYFRNLWNRFEDLEDRIETIYDYREGDLESQTATSGTFTEGEGEKTFKHRLEKQSISQSTLGGEFLFNDTTLYLSATIGSAEQDTPFDIEYSFEVADALAMDYDTSDFFPRVTTSDDFEDANFWEFNQLDRVNQIVEEDLHILQADIRHDMDFGRDYSGYFKAGIKGTSREKTSNLGGTIYDGFADDLLLSQFASPGRPGFYDSVRPGFYNFGPIVNFPGAEDFFRANEGDFEISDDDTAAENFSEDYTVDEDVYAAYIMAGADVRNWNFTGGFRVEETQSDYSAFAVQFDDGDFVDAVPVQGSNSYTDFLPAFLVRYQATEQLVIRGALTNTLARPGYVQLVPFQIFEFEPNDDDELEGEVEEGNPELDRLTSNNIDLSFEYYLESGGILAAGLFFKDIDNPIYNRTQTFENIDFEGRFFTELQRTRPENADSGELLGIELNYQQQFVELPSPWNSFGVSVNYTYTDSEATVFDRSEKLPFFLQSDHIGNASLFFERAGFEARLAWAYRSQYLDEVGGDINEDIYIDDRSQLDFKASYDFTDKLTAYLEVRNITDEPLRYLSGDGFRRLAENEIYGWNALMGIKIDL